MASRLAPRRNRVFPARNLTLPFFWTHSAQAAVWPIRFFPAIIIDKCS